MITIIIPTVNRSTLDNALQSLVDQTNPNWKAIVVGDRCRPNNMVRDSRIMTLNTLAATGAGPVRNFGIQFVWTKWVGFLDDDDTLDPSYVQQFYDLYNDHDAIFFKMYMEKFPVTPGPKIDQAGIAFACKKEIFDEIRFEDGRMEDVKVWTYIRDNYKVIYTPEIGYKIGDRVG